MPRLSSLTLLTVSLLASAGVCHADGPASFKAGVARKAITPAEPMWMAGYASRTAPAEGKEHDLWVKALALEDARGNKLVVLTSDLCGIPRSLSEAVAADVAKRTGLARERLMLTCSHTHCGPVVRDNLMDMYPMPPEQHEKIRAYTKQLRGWMVEAVEQSLADLKPARLAVGAGTARFAVNRREPTPQGVINGINPSGPVDHSVPVLKVEDAASGKLRAIVFGYACHNTTLAYNKWCGDYAGFAQIELEKKHPGATALFWIGCGGDANPLPRRKLELCVKYGRELAEAVDTVLGAEMTPVRGTFAARYAEVSLPFEKVPGPEKWKQDLLSKQFAARKRAEHYLKLIEAGKSVPGEYPVYPVQVWKLGDQVVWVSLGGEVVVDYALRLKKELQGPYAVWVTAYANDVMAYIGSARVIREGGYEGDTSMVYYGMPGKWDTSVEEKIISKVHELVKAVNPTP